jgi:hypothetical protein
MLAITNDRRLVAKHWGVVHSAVTPVGRLLPRLLLVICATGILLLVIACAVESVATWHHM